MCDGDSAPPTRRESSRRPSLFKKLIERRLSHQSDASTCSSGCGMLKTDEQQAQQEVTQLSTQQQRKRFSFKRAISHRQSFVNRCPGEPQPTPADSAVIADETAVSEVLNMFAEYEDEAWETKMKKEGSVCSKIFPVIDERKSRSRLASVSLFMDSLVPLHVAHPNLNLDSWEENAEAEESLSNRVVAGGEEALATKLLLSQLAEAAKPPRTNREFLWRRALESDCGNEATVLKLLAFREGKQLMRKEFQELSDQEFWGGLKVLVSYDSRCIEAESNLNLRKLLGRRQSEALIHTFRSLRKR